ncbi:hypothetical protein BDAP_000747 [Binucleata daphniae]
MIEKFIKTVESKVKTSSPFIKLKYLNEIETLEKKHLNMLEMERKLVCLSDKILNEDMHKQFDI